jgi:hypothetical protein
MRQTAAIVEALGVLFALKDHGDDYEQDTVVDLMHEAGSLGQALGGRALEPLDAHGPVSGRKRRRRRSGTERPPDAPRPRLAAVACAESTTGTAPVLAQTLKIEDAAKRLGIAAPTMKRWLRRQREGLGRDSS